MSMGMLNPLAAPRDSNQPPSRFQTVADEQQQAVDRERERADGLARELAAARAALESALAAGLQALQIADDLTVELNSVTDELEASNQRIVDLTTGQAVPAWPDSPVSPVELFDLRPQPVEPSSVAVPDPSHPAELPAEQAIASIEPADLTVHQAAPRWPVSPVSPVELFDLRPQEPAVEARSISVPETARLAEPPAAETLTAAEPSNPEPRPTKTEPTEPKATIGAAAPAPVPRSDEQQLLARAGGLLRQADISNARPLLELAMARGSARAAFMLAETYDERVLKSWRVRGIAGDRTKARELYERAQLGGIEEATDRLAILK